MRWFHLVLGLALFVVFLITGQYMRADFPDKEAIGQDLRLLMRSRHIYILFSAFVHLALGVYLVLRPRFWQRAVQIAGSAVLVLSSSFLVSAWYIETYAVGQFSDISRNGIYAALWGIGLHLIGGIALGGSDR